MAEKETEDPDLTPRSTREIMADWNGKRKFGHNPSWVKANSHENLVLDLRQRIDSLESQLDRIGQ